MKTLHKILLLIFSIVGLSGSVCLLLAFQPLPPFTYAGIQYQGARTPLIDVCTGFCVFLCICFLAILLISIVYPRQTSRIVVPKGSGALTFSKQAVESVVRHSFADVEGISFCRIKTKIYGKPEKTRVYVKLALAGAGSMAQSAADIQAKIESTLQSTLDITARSVSIDVDGAHTEDRVQPNAKAKTSALI